MTGLFQQFKKVQGYVGQGTTALVTSDVVSLKNAHRAWIVVDLDTTASSACALTPMRATDVALTGGAVLTTAVPILVDTNTANSDALVAATAAVNYTTAADANYKTVIFEIDPAAIGAYDCIYITVGALAATEALCVNFFLETRYAQATPPSAIVD